MPIVPATTLYTVILGAWLILLSLRVIALRSHWAFRFLRRHHEIGNQEKLERAIRGQANMVEYTPMFLILMLMAEIHGLSGLILQALGITFVLGRGIHGIVFCFVRHHPTLRLIGMILTLTPMMILLGIDLSYVMGTIR